MPELSSLRLSFFLNCSYILTNLSLAVLYSKESIEIDFLVRISARMDFFCRSSQIVFFSSSEAPESDKIGILLCSSVKMGFTQQLQLLFGFLSPVLDNSTCTLLTAKTLQHHISIKFISINYKYKKYNIIFQGDKI